MKCDVCGKDLRQVESSLVCPNGHTIQNTLEVVDEEIKGVTSGRKRKIRKERVLKRRHEGRHWTVSAMMLFVVLYREAQDVFRIRTDAPLRYFTGYFRIRGQKTAESEAASALRRQVLGDELADAEEKQTQHEEEWVDGDIEIGSTMLAALIYIAKRSESEKQGECYFYKDFTAKMAEFDMNHRATGAARKYGVLQSTLSMMGFPLNLFDLRGIQQRISFLADFDVFKQKDVTITVVHPTGVIPLWAEQLKRNFRALLPHDMGIYRKYFDFLCAELEIEQEESLIRYWEKFIHTENLDRVFIPEHKFTLFIVLYLVDLEKFEGTPDERRILKYLKLPRVAFRDEMDQLSTRLNGCVDPEKYLRLLEKEYMGRYRNLARAIRLIDAFKDWIGTREK